MRRLAPDSPSILVSLRLSPDMHDALHMRCKHERRSLSDLMRSLIEAGMEGAFMPAEARLRRIEREAREVRRSIKIGDVD